MVAAANLVEVAALVGDTARATMLAALPRQQRLSVALFYVDGLSVAEVASTLGISEGAVKFHLHEGRAKLRGSVDAERAT